MYATLGWCQGGQLIGIYGSPMECLCILTGIQTRHPFMHLDAGKGSPRMGRSGRVESVVAHPVTGRQTLSWDRKKQTTTECSIDYPLLITDKDANSMEWRREGSAVGYF